MSDAGDFVLACRRRKVEIVLVGEEVSLRGCRSDVDALMPRLTRCVNEVHDLVSAFVYAAPPRRGVPRH